MSLNKDILYINLHYTTFHQEFFSLSYLMLPQERAGQTETFQKKV